MLRALVTDVRAALEEEARKHHIVWDSMYSDFRNCPDEMMATDENDVRFKRWEIASWQISDSGGQRT